MRKILAIMILAGLFLVGCAADDDDSGAEVPPPAPATAAPDDDGAGEEVPDEPAPAEPEEAPDDGTADAPEPDASAEPEPTPTPVSYPMMDGLAPGVTDDSIKIGITYVDLESIRQIVNIDHGDYEASYQAVIDDINANGGVHGRMIEVVFASINPLGVAPAEEACVALVEDEEVFVTIGFFIGDTPLCYLDTYQRPVIGGEMTPERLERAAAPWFTTEAGSDLEEEVIRTFAAEGLFDGRLAVFSIISLETQLNEGVLPLLEELGVTPVEVAVLDAPANDVFAQNSATAVVVERFRSSDVDTVFVHAGGALPWVNGVEATSFRPRLLLTDKDSIAAFVKDETDRDLSVVEGAIVGGLYGPAQSEYEEPLMQECITTQLAAGVEITPPNLVEAGDPETHVAPRIACRNVALLVAILEGAGPKLNHSTFQYAGENLGEVEIPGVPDPHVFGPPPSADGDPKVYLFEFDPEEEDFLLRD